MHRFCRKLRQVSTSDDTEDNDYEETTERVQKGKHERPQGKGSKAKVQKTKRKQGKLIAADDSWKTHAELPRIKIEWTDDSQNEAYIRESQQYEDATLQPQDSVDTGGLSRSERELRLSPTRDDTGQDDVSAAQDDEQLIDFASSIDLSVDELMPGERDTKPTNPKFLQSHELGITLAGIMANWVTLPLTKSTLT